MFLILLILFLIYNKISLSDFILQLFLFPQSIGTSRYENYSLGIKNIFFDYKFIYFTFLIILFLNLKESIKKELY